MRCCVESRKDAGGSISVVIGGPPCPPYSKSRFYRKEKPRALDDDLGQRTMDGYLRTLRVVRPTHSSWKTFPASHTTFTVTHLTTSSRKQKKLGYTSEGRVVNAADYGVPQLRERFFLSAS